MQYNGMNRAGEWGLTPLDFRRPEYADILDAWELRARELFGNGANLTVHSPLGMFIRIFAWFGGRKTDEFYQPICYRLGYEHLMTGRLTTDEDGRIDGVRAGNVEAYINTKVVTLPAVVDNLNSASAAAALTAKQGKVLNDAITTANAAITAINAAGYQNASQVEDAVNQAVGAFIGGFIVVVNELPEEGESGKIYLVPDSDSLTGAAIEYIWDGAQYERIGTTDADLTDYVKKTVTVNGKALSANITLAASDVGAAPTSHASTGTTYGVSSAGNYGHAMASSAAPLVAGTAAVGTDNGKYAREGHVHPAQSIDGGAANTANTLATPRNINVSGDVTGTAQPFNGSAPITIPTTLASVTRTDQTDTAQPDFGGAFDVVGAVVSDAKGRITSVNKTTVTLPEAPFLPVNTTNTAPTGTTRYNCEGYLYATRLYGAVYNDYAEYRRAQPGMACEAGRWYRDAGGVLREEAPGRYANAFIVSDTYGQCLGAADGHRSPVALAGRVLAFVEHRERLKSGDILGTSRRVPGALSRLSRLEIILHPEWIVGAVSETPRYKVWHGIDVNDRVWVNVR